MRLIFLSLNAVVNLSSSNSTNFGSNWLVRVEILLVPSSPEKYLFFSDWIVKGELLTYLTEFVSVEEE